MKCPRCGRKTYSEKWQSCSGCGLGTTPVMPHATSAAARVRVGPIAELSLVNVQATGNGWLAIDLRQGGIEHTIGFALPVAAPGEPCIACSRPLPMTAAERKQKQRKRTAGDILKEKGKPQGSNPPVEVTPGPPVSDYVSEDRGER